jgi:hypothetical protein
VTDHQVCSKNNTTGGTRGAGTVYPSGAPDFNPFSVGIQTAQKCQNKNIKKTLEDTKVVIRSRKSKKYRQYNGQRKKGQTTIYKILYRKLKIEQHETH